MSYDEDKEMWNVVGVLMGCWGVEAKKLLQKSPPTFYTIFSTFYSIYDIILHQLPQNQYTYPKINFKMRLNKEVPKYSTHKTKCKNFPNQITSLALTLTLFLIIISPTTPLSPNSYTSSHHLTHSMNKWGNTFTYSSHSSSTAAVGTAAVAAVDTIGNTNSKITKITQLKTNNRRTNNRSHYRLYKATRLSATVEGDQAVGDQAVGDQVIDVQQAIDVQQDIDVQQAIDVQSNDIQSNGVQSNDVQFEHELASQQQTSPVIETTPPLPQFSGENGR